MEAIFKTIKIFVKRNRGKISNIFCRSFLAKPQCLDFYGKKFMFLAKIKKALTKSLSELLANYFIINVIIVLIIQKIIKFQKLKHLQNLV